MRLYAYLFLLLIAAGCTKNTTASKQLWPVMQTITDETSTTFVIQKNKTEALQYYYFDKSWKKINNMRSYQQAYSNTVIEHISLSGLSTDKNYKLKIRSNASEDIRSFKTLKHKDTYLITAASCMMDSDQKMMLPIVSQMAKTNADITFLIGDNVYADFDPKKLIKLTNISTQTLWKRHAETRAALPLFYSKKLRPILATWDDHDFGKNNGNKYFKHKKQSLNIFKIFFGLKNISSPNYSDGPGLSYVAQLGSQQFIFLDNRYFRDKKGEGSHWGQQQEDWLLKLLKKSTTPSWIINGDQFWGGYHPFESFEGDRPHHFKKTMTKLASASAYPLAFLTGDRHLSEITETQKNDFPYKTLEITTSPLHAKLYPSRWDKRPNHRQVKGIAQVHNYALIKSKANGRQISGEAIAIGPKNKILFKHKFKVSQ